jgi:alkylation response protein AidB-like acyl-CoA dehydrogenase
VFFDYASEQQDLLASVRRYLAEFQPVSAARELLGSELGYDPGFWRKMAANLGLPGIAVAEQYGGAGGSFIELGLVMSELGRVMYSGPFLATAGLAASLLAESGDEAAMADYLPGIADGSLLAAAAITEDTTSGLPDLGTVTAERSGGGWLLSGQLGYVLDGAAADLILVPAAVDGQRGLFAVRGSAEGVHRVPLTVMDQTRRFAQVKLRSAEGRLIGDPAGVDRVLAVASDLARVALAAEQAGGAQACLEMATAYAGQRVQFGRPIGSFQAIKHKCATLLVEVESALAAAQYAAWAAAASRADLPVATVVAKICCSDTFFHAAAENIQIHGGIGFTWEQDAHLYFKRAKSSQILLGHPVHHRERLATLMGV